MVRSVVRSLAIFLLAFSAMAAPPVNLLENGGAEAFPQPPALFSNADWVENYADPFEGENVYGMSNTIVSTVFQNATIAWVDPIEPTPGAKLRVRLRVRPDYAHLPEHLILTVFVVAGTEITPYAFTLDDFPDDSWQMLQTPQFDATADEYTLVLQTSQDGGQVVFTERIYVDKVEFLVFGG